MSNDNTSLDDIRQRVKDIGDRIVECEKTGGHEYTIQWQSATIPTEPVVYFCQKCTNRVSLDVAERYIKAKQQKMAKIQPTTLLDRDNLFIALIHKLNRQGKSVLIRAEDIANLGRSFRNGKPQVGTEDTREGVVVRLVESLPEAKIPHATLKELFVCDACDGIVRVDLSTHESGYVCRDCGGKLSTSVHVLNEIAKERALKKKWSEETYKQNPMLTLTLPEKSND